MMIKVIIPINSLFLSMLSKRFNDSVLELNALNTVEKINKVKNDVKVISF